MTLFEQLLEDQIESAKFKHEQQTKGEKKMQELQDIWTQGAEEAQTTTPEADKAA